MARIRYCLIRGYAEAAGYNLDQLAEKIGISRRALDNRLYGITDFTLPEADKVKSLLGKSIEEIFLPTSVA